MILDIYLTETKKSKKEITSSIFRTINNLPIKFEENLKPVK